MSTTSPVTTPDDMGAGTASQDREDAASPPSARSVFVDLARAAAILMMLQGHTVHAVLASDARTGTAFYLWSFARGLTSCAFLMLSGFVFTLATQRYWTASRPSPSATGRRLRRFGFFLCLGYALHFPTANITHLYGLS